MRHAPPGCGAPGGGEAGAPLRPPPPGRLSPHLQIRATALTLYYNVGAAIGGNGPLVVTAINRPFAPAYFIAAGSLVSVFAGYYAYVRNKAYLEDREGMQVAHLRPVPY